MKFEIIEPITDVRWLNFITGVKNSNIFHHPAWLKVIKKEYKFNIHAACILNESKQIVAGIPYSIIKVLGSPKKIISLPFTDHCYFLSHDSQFDELISSELIKVLKNKNVASIELRTSVKNKEYNKNESLVLHITQIDQDIDEVFHKFKKSQVQQIIKKASNYNLEVNFETSYSAVEEFYKLHLITRKKLGVPIQPKHFFKLIFDEIISKNFGFIIIIKKDGIPISSGVFMFFNKYFTYKFGASDPDYLKYRPNNIMIWEGMKYANKNGFKYFDFGKTEIENEGLRKFKSGWGAEESKLIYSFYPKQIHSPLSLLKDLVISPLIKKSPKIVCQLIGEIGYKYFPSL